MYELKIEDFNLDQIMGSGQCFRWKDAGNGRISITAYGKYMEAVQKGDVFVFSCGEDEFKNVWAEYFDMGTDYGRIKETADSSDTYLQEAIRFGSGIRILRQELWEMLVSFIISQNNNIPRIRKNIEAICEKYGEEIIGRGIDGQIRRAYAFPEPKILAAAKTAGLEGLGLGYRDKYIEAVSLWWMEQGFSDSIQAAGWLLEEGYEGAVSKLLQIKGIGRKVADCVCLFGLHCVEAFPMDTHMKKIEREHYRSGFPLEKYNGCAGIMQQYLFYYDLAGESGALESAAARE